MNAGAGPLPGDSNDAKSSKTARLGRRASWSRSLLMGLAFIAAIVVSTEFARHLGIQLSDGTSVTTIWPAIGIALGIVLRFGIAFWPAVLIGNTLSLLRIGLPPGTFTVSLIADTAYPLIATLLLDHCGFDRRLLRTKDVFLLGFGAGLAGTLLPISLEAITYVIDAVGAPTASNVLPIILEWWLESAMGVIVATPLFLVLHPAESFRMSRTRSLEGIGLLLVGFTVSVAMNRGADLSSRFGQAISLVVFPLSLWAAFRFGKSGAAMLAACCALGATLGRAGTITPIGTFDLNAVLIDQTAFLIVISLFGMTIASMLLSRDGTELLLNSTQSSFHSLFEHSPIGIAIERGGVVRFANRSLLDTLGCGDAEEILGRSTDDWLELGSAGRRAGEREATCRRSDGSRVSVVVSEAAIPQVDGLEIIRFVSDRSDRQALEADLQRSRRMESIGLLAGGIAHDFNNLLTVIAGYVDLIRETTPSSSDAAIPLEHVATATEKASALTRQLLAFGRTKGGVIERLDLSAKVRELVPILRRLVGEHIELVLDLAPDPPHVTIDGSFVDQILLNLVTNARDAITNGGRVILRTRSLVVPRENETRRNEWKPGHYMVLEVTDTGVGMDSETQKKAFDPFFTTKPVGKGSGIGLSSVRGLAESLGAEIRLTSQVGFGTMVSIGIPVTEEPISKPAAVDPAGDAGTDRASILVVQDDPALRGLILQVLRRERYSVKAVASVSEALELLAQRSGRCDLLVTDVMMPRMSGAELARCVRRHWPMVRCLFIAGYSEPELLAIRREIPTHELLSKPFTTSQLVERVRAALTTLA